MSPTQPSAAGSLYDCSQPEQHAEYHARGFDCPCHPMIADADATENAIPIRTIHVMAVAQHSADRFEAICGFVASHNEPDDQNVLVEFASDAETYERVTRCPVCFA